MATEIIRRLVAFVVLCLVQALVLNQISLLGHATPLLYIFFVITFPRNYSRVGMLLWSFAMGVVVDTFTNTPGVATASLTLMAFIQPDLLQVFIPRESADDLVPSAQTLGWGSYAVYALIMTLVYCLVYFSLEAFSFFNWLLWLVDAFSSALLTYIFIMVLESFRRGKPA